MVLLLEPQNLILRLKGFDVKMVHAGELLEMVFHEGSVRLHLTNRVVARVLVVEDQGLQGLQACQRQYIFGGEKEILAQVEEL